MIVKYKGVLAKSQDEFDQYILEENGFNQPEFLRSLENGQKITLSLKFGKRRIILTGKLVHADEWTRFDYYDREYRFIPNNLSKLQGIVEAEQRTAQRAAQRKLQCIQS